MFKLDLEEDKTRVYTYNIFEYSCNISTELGKLEVDKI